MTELKPKPSSRRSRTVSFHALETEAGFMDSLCLAAAGETDALVQRDHPTKIKPPQHSIEIVKQLIDFIQSL